MKPEWNGLDGIGWCDISFTQDVIKRSTWVVAMRGIKADESTRGIGFGVAVYKQRTSMHPSGPARDMNGYGGFSHPTLVGNDNYFLFQATPRINASSLMFSNDCACGRLSTRSSLTVGH